jgi:hypothetical protein
VKRFWISIGYPLVNLLLCSCASTRIYENGQLIAVIQGDAQNVTIKTAHTQFHADVLMHSTATRAGGEIVGTAVTGATSVAGAVITSGLLR